MLFRNQQRNKVLETFNFLTLLLKVCLMFKMKTHQNKLLNISLKVFNLIILILILVYIIYYKELLGLSFAGKSIEIVLINTVRTMDRIGYLIFPIINMLVVAFSNKNYEKFFNDLEKVHEILRIKFDIKFNYLRLKLANILIFFMIHLATFFLFRQFVVVIIIEESGGFFFTIYFMEAFIFITQRCFYVCIVFHYFVILRAIRLKFISSENVKILKQKENILQIIRMILFSIEDFNRKFGLIAFLTIGKNWNLKMCILLFIYTSFYRQSIH